MDSACELAELSERLTELVVRLREKRLCRGRVPPDRGLDELELECERNQPLLRTVVEVALEPPSLAVGRVEDLYFGGDFEAMFALGGQVAGRIESVRPVAAIVRETITEFESVMQAMGRAVT